MKEGRVVSRDPEVMSGELVFAGTRVEVETFVDYLKAGHTPDDFASASRDQAEGYPETTPEAGR